MVEEWPPHSGRRERFAEIDRVGWFDGASARPKIHAAQLPFVERAEPWLATHLSRHPPQPADDGIPRGGGDG